MCTRWVTEAMLLVLVGSLGACKDQPAQAPVAPAAAAPAAAAASAETAGRAVDTWTAPPSSNPGVPPPPIWAGTKPPASQKPKPPPLQCLLFPKKSLGGRITNERCGPGGRGHVVLPGSLGVGGTLDADWNLHREPDNIEFLFRPGGGCWTLGETEVLEAKCEAKLVEDRLIRVDVEFCVVIPEPTTEIRIVSAGCERIEAVCPAPHLERSARQLAGHRRRWDERR